MIYLHPNALYAEVEYAMDNDTLTLIRGHGISPQKLQMVLDGNMTIHIHTNMIINVKTGNFMKLITVLC